MIYKCKPLDSFAITVYNSILSDFQLVHDVL